MSRLFLYNGQQFEDPGEHFTNDDVRKSLAAHFPRLATAEQRESVRDDGTVVVEFVETVGRKG